MSEYINSKTEGFYKIETGIIVDVCRLNSDMNKIIGAGCISYYKTPEQYEASKEEKMEMFSFSFNLDTEEIVVFNTDYEKDIDKVDLIQSIKINLLKK